jgi:hypothetical protein
MKINNFLILKCMKFETEEKLLQNKNQLSDIGKEYEVA